MYIHPVTVAIAKLCMFSTEICVRVDWAVVLCCVAMAMHHGQCGVEQEGGAGIGTGPQAPPGR